MTPERWRRTEQLYHEALARPPADRAAFLAAACSDDTSMQRNVRSLLAESKSDDGFLAKPALVLPAHVVAELVPPVITGRTLSGYHLRELLGAGGMGEVASSARHRLERDVAIKILPSAFTSNRERLARF